LPGTRVKTDRQRVGHPRSFTDFEGFSIAVAAALLDAGLRRDIIARFFDAMTQIEWQRRTARRNRLIGPLEAAFSSSESSCLAKIADGRYLAVQIGARKEHWFDLQSARFNSVRHDPRIIVTIDLTRIRQEIRK
ncbi:MAG: hypothetical protein WAN65_22360, partial [Candidatus Sulfotelmatobacter sp.]